MGALTIGNGQREALVQPTANIPQPRLVKAAHEFEAAMMKEILRPLESGQEDDSQGDEGRGSAAALTSFAGEALGKALSERGGFGIASRIIHQVTNESNHNGKLSVTNIPMRELVISPPK